MRRAKALLCPRRTCISCAFEKASDEFDRVGQRPGASRVIVLLSDGEQTSQLGGFDTALQAADAVKATGVEVFAAGFGTAKLESLQQIASTPQPTHAFFALDLDTQAAHRHEMRQVLILVAKPTTVVQQPGGGAAVAVPVGTAVAPVPTAVPVGSYA